MNTTAKQSSGKRRDFDFYPTPAKATHVLFDYAPFIKGCVLEPCSGDGAIASVIEERLQRTIITNDIDIRSQADFHLDAAIASSWEKFPQPDWIVTNPPFNEALPILQNSFEKTKLGVAFLLRLSFLEPTRKRAAWLRFIQQYQMMELIFGQPRISFTGDGKVDSVTHLWMVWCKNKTTAFDRYYVTNWNQ